MWFKFSFILYVLYDGYVAIVKIAWLANCHISPCISLFHHYALTQNSFKESMSVRLHLKRTQTKWPQQMMITTQGLVQLLQLELYWKMIFHLFDLISIVFSFYELDVPSNKCSHHLLPFPDLDGKLISFKYSETSQLPDLSVSQVVISASSVSFSFLDSCLMFY